jgi:putative endonuclease
MGLNAWGYVLRLRSGSLYVGSTTNLERRLQDHFAGHGCRTTGIDLPLKLAHCEIFESINDAERRESQLKRWSRAKKEALIRAGKDELHQLSRRRSY